ncbi:hypothetical protein B566_EDAN017645 [Ephemera danica]|nr:hypothetical protein B566_EDAN017645 [Ephemera danica]
MCLFRFRTISSNDFAIQVCPIKLLDTSEERDVLCCLAVPQCPMPIGFSKEIKQRTKYVKPVEPVEVKELVNVNYSTFYGFSFIRSILGNRIQGFSSKFDVYVLGVKVRGMRYTPRNPGPPPKYIEKFQVTIKSKDNEAMGTYQGELSTGHTAEVMFETPYFAPANTFHAMFVRYAQPNIQSFSYLYRSHELRTKSDKIFEIWSEYSHIVAVLLTQKQNFHLYQESLNKVETVAINT